MVTPTLTVRGSPAVIEFYRKAFNATEIMRMDGPNGVIVEAEIALGPERRLNGLEWAKLSAPDVAPPCSVELPVEDVQQVLSTALAAGARVVRPDGTIQDPFGKLWHLAPASHG